MPDGHKQPRRGTSASRHRPQNRLICARAAMRDGTTPKRTYSPFGASCPAHDIPARSLAVAVPSDRRFTTIAPPMPQLRGQCPRFMSTEHPHILSPVSRPCLTGTGPLRDWSQLGRPAYSPPRRHFYGTHAVGADGHGRLRSARLRSLACAERPDRGTIAPSSARSEPTDQPDITSPIPAAVRPSRQ